MPPRPIERGNGSETPKHADRRQGARRAPDSGGGSGMKLALVPHRGRPEAVELARRMAEQARARSVEVAAHEEDAPLLGAAVTGFEPDCGIDAVAAIGGDGTVLRAVRLALPAGLPVLGINTGRLGFLAEGEPEEAARIVERLATGDYRITERMTLSARTEGGEAAGLNDVVMEKTESQKTVSLAVSVDGEEFTTYRADGLVAATPTGSTAYNLSAGGPLVDPALDALVLTPVAPHTLFSRTLVFPPHRILRFEVRDQQPVGVTVDGNEIGRVEPGGSVTVTAGGRAPFITLHPRSFPAALQRKFHLG